MIFKLEFLRYAFSSLVLNSLGFISFVVFLEYLHVSPIMSVIVLNPIIFSMYYIMQTYFVFKKKINLKSLVQFLLNCFFFYFLNICAIFVCTKIFNFNAIISQFFILVMLGLINYLSQKKIIFKLK